jgi:hypothetical protein
MEGLISSPVTGEAIRDPGRTMIKTRTRRQIALRILQILMTLMRSKIPLDE